MEPLGLGFIEKTKRGSVGPALGLHIDLLGNHNFLLFVPGGVRHEASEVLVGDQGRVCMAGFPRESGAHRCAEAAKFKLLGTGFEAPAERMFPLAVVAATPRGRRCRGPARTWPESSWHQNLMCRQPLGCRRHGSVGACAPARCQVCDPKREGLGTEMCQPTSANCRHLADGRAMSRHFVSM